MGLGNFKKKQAGKSTLLALVIEEKEGVLKGKAWHWHYITQTLAFTQRFSRWVPRTIKDYEEWISFSSLLRSNVSLCLQGKRSGCSKFCSQITWGNREDQQTRPMRHTNGVTLPHLLPESSAMHRSSGAGQLGVPW